MRILSVFSFVAISVCAIAQNSPPALEAASIKPNKSAGERPREELAQALSNFADRPIIDKTGIDGLFDINSAAFRPDRFGPNFAAEVHADPESLPTIFTMVEDQLGLKLESRKGPVVVIVIDSVQKPSEN